MASESDVRTISTLILAIAMIGFALAFYAMGSAMYLLLAFIGVVLALMIASGVISSKR